MPLKEAGSFQELTRAIVTQLNQGVSQADVIVQLVARGWPEVSANEYVTRQAVIAGNMRRKSENDGDVKHYYAMVYKRRMKRGLLWTLGGLAISLASLSLAQTGGAASFIFFGAIIVSVIDFLAGLVGWLRVRK